MNIKWVSWWCHCLTVSYIFLYDFFWKSSFLLKHVPISKYIRAIKHYSAFRVDLRQEWLSHSWNMGILSFLWTKLMENLIFSFLSGEKQEVIFRGATFHACMPTENTAPYDALTLAIRNMAKGSLFGDFQVWSCLFGSFWIEFFLLPIKDLLNVPPPPKKKKKKKKKNIYIYIYIFKKIKKNLLYANLHIWLI